MVTVSEIISFEFIYSKKKWIFYITFALTMTACPTISVPCGFTSEGLPVGIQIMGKPRGEAALLQVAKQFEQAIGISNKLPITPKTNLGNNSE